MQYVEGPADEALQTAVTAATAAVPPYIGPLVGSATDALTGLLKNARDAICKLISGYGDVYTPGNLVLHEDQPRVYEITITSIDDGGDLGVYTGTFELQVATPKT